VAERIRIVCHDGVTYERMASREEINQLKKTEFITRDRATGQMTVDFSKSTPTADADADADAVEEEYS
jgi:hypothetical protein